MHFFSTYKRLSHRDTLQSIRFSPGHTVHKVEHGAQLSLELIGDIVQKTSLPIRCLNGLLPFNLLYFKLLSHPDYIHNPDNQNNGKQDVDNVGQGGCIPYRAYEYGHLADIPQRLITGGGMGNLKYVMPGRQVQKIHPSGFRLPPFFVKALEPVAELVFCLGKIEIGKLHCKGVGRMWQVHFISPVGRVP